MPSRTAGLTKQVIVSYYSVICWVVDIYAAEITCHLRVKTNGRLVISW